jgi:hypothetical protein
MNTTFQNSAQVLSIGIFFTLMIVGLSASLPQSLYQGLVAHGVSSAAASKASHLPPVSTLFAAFLGYNPVQHLLGSHVLSQIPPAQQAVLSGRGFFPSIITAPFRSGLHAALDFAIVASLLAAAASWTRGAPSGEKRHEPAVPGADRSNGRVSVAAAASAMSSNGTSATRKGTSPLESPS